MDGITNISAERLHKPPASVSRAHTLEPANNRTIKTMKRTRLDRRIVYLTALSQRDVRLAVAQNRIRVDGRPAQCVNQVVDQFSCIELDHRRISGEAPLYILLHKPAGVVSATRCDKHQTVIDCLRDNSQLALSEYDLAQLHIAGRLDFHTTGLMLLTNDGKWSRNLSLPERKIAKRYSVELANPIDHCYRQAFKNGFYFAHEDCITQPAKLVITDPYHAEVSLIEGRYHQIKRMFGRFRNRVVTLHRHSVGTLSLGDLPCGGARMIEPSELLSLAKTDIQQSMSHD